MPAEPWVSVEDAARHLVAESVRGGGSSDQARSTDDELRVNKGSTSHRAQLGFLDGERGAHSHATLMIRGITSIFASTSPAATPADYARVVVDENLLGKRTAAARKHTLNNLVNLYAMDPSVPVFRIFRELWEQDPEGRSLLALLCALARDPLLRGSVQTVLETPLGERLPSSALAATVTRQMAPATKKAIGTRNLSSWAQAGFLDSPRKRNRVRPRATPGAAAYALALGFMEGGRGSLLLTTSWTRVLDCPADEVLALVRQAARRGWVQYRAAGDVIDLRVEALFTDDERGCCDGQ
ncbi:MAG: hypothetical protein IPK80_28845 [Nannocystis sp.]|nr:hypothetical protein [Nannocystis sp.]